MSFALEYRKTMQSRARAAEAGMKKPRKAGPAKLRARSRKSAQPAAPGSADFVLEAPRKATDTAGNRLRMLAALSIAGMILSVFNSGALVRYAGGLGYNQAAMRVILASESWHALMQDSGMTALVEGIREATATARYSQWQDLALGLELKPNHPYLRDRAAPDAAEKDAGAKAGALRDADPVMRAAAGR